MTGNVVTLKPVLEVPRYTTAEAARYLHLPVSTLRSWTNAGPYSVAGTNLAAPLIARPDPDDPLLSFSNLVEAHVLRSLRTKHRLSMDVIRHAIRDAEGRYNIPRLLVSRELCATPGRMFLDRLGELVEISAAGQRAIREYFMAHLDRLDRDHEGTPFRLYPFSREPNVPENPNVRENPRVVVIDPQVSFGRPVIERGSIKTSTIVERFDSGESVQLIAEDYDLAADEIEEAIRYEHFQRAA